MPQILPYPERYRDVKTPCYIVEEELLRKNAELLHSVEERSGAHILLAQKAFSMFYTYPLLRNYLSGTTASGIYEARLGREKFGRETHVFSPAYTEEDLKELLQICDHIVFNTPAQIRKFRKTVQEYREREEGNGQKISLGLRINPEYSEIETDIYNPCFEYSRLGTTLAELEKAPDILEDIEGIHFHTMCEQNAGTLERTLLVVEEKFGRFLESGQIKWVNFGGGHHITREDYDVELLIRCIRHIWENYDVEVYVEPGEAVGLNTGFLVSTVLDVLKNGMNLAILDTSAACHMPDVLEMPYRPEIIEKNGRLAGLAGEKAFTYRLGGPTCLAGDIIGDYSFDEPLREGDKLVFCDMAHYSMVKNNTFNGMKLPSILYRREDGVIETVKEFGYEDFKGRLS
jgi:carboxynorspermidine decarboxylase